MIQHSETSWLEKLRTVNAINSEGSDDRIEAFMEDPLLGIRSTRGSVSSGGGTYVSNHGAGSSSK